MSPGWEGLATPLDTVGVLSRGLLRLRGLKTFVGARRVVARPSARQARELSAVVGWGHKPSADRARAFARRHHLPYLALEDGFRRSVGLGPGEPPLSLVVDDLGIYYDARAPSRLESLLAGDGPVDLLADESLIRRARRCRERIVEAQLKFGSDPDIDSNDPLDKLLSASIKDRAKAEKARHKDKKRKKTKLKVSNWKKTRYILSRMISYHIRSKLTACSFSKITARTSMRVSNR